MRMLIVSFAVRPDILLGIVQVTPKEFIRMEAVASDAVTKPI